MEEVEFHFISFVMVKCLVFKRSSCYNIVHADLFKSSAIGLIENSVMRHILLYFLHIRCMYIHIGRHGNNISLVFHQEYSLFEITPVLKFTME